MSTQVPSELKEMTEELQSAQREIAKLAAQDDGAEAAPATPIDDDAADHIVPLIGHDEAGASAPKKGKSRKADIEAEVMAIAEAVSNTVSRLALDNEKLARDRDKFIDYANALEKRHRATLNSTSWKITAPVRFAKKVFGKIVLRRPMRTQKALVRPKT